LAPLHNPVLGIEDFDTAYHQNMPEKAYLYALPQTHHYVKTKRMGPNSGLIMVVDILILRFFFYLLEKGYIFNCLNKKSGMMVICGRSDMRDIRNAYDKGKKKYEMYAYRIKSILNGIDAIIFTGGVGEHDEIARSLVCNDLDILGIFLDEDKNKLITKTTRDVSSVKILIIPTDEKMQIAQEIWALLQKRDGNPVSTSCRN